MKNSHDTLHNMKVKKVPFYSLHNERICCAIWNIFKTITFFLFWIYHSYNNRNHTSNFRRDTKGQLKSALNCQCVCSRPNQIAQWIESLTQRSAILAVFYIFSCFCSHLCACVFFANIRMKPVHLCGLNAFAAVFYVDSHTVFVRKSV